MILRLALLVALTSIKSSVALTFPNLERSRQKTFDSALILRQAKENAPISVSNISFDNLQDKKILVVGGSGRVGGSVVTQLAKRGSDVTVGGTKVENFARARERWLRLFPEYSNNIEAIEFVSLDRESVASVSRVLEGGGFDLVVHTAGPFQGKVRNPNGVIDGAISNSVPYVDVCDDFCTASAAKRKYSEKAKNRNVPCIISTGCWPGVSSLMASVLIRKVLQEDKSLKPEDVTGALCQRFGWDTNSLIFLTLPSLTACAKKSSFHFLLRAVEELV